MSSLFCNIYTISVLNGPSIVKSNNYKKVVSKEKPK